MLGADTMRHANDIDKPHDYKVVPARFPTENGQVYERWLITDHKLPVLELNEWLETKSLRKVSTAREYANKLAVFLNFLSSKNIEYKDATRNDVLAFIDYLIYGLWSGFVVLSLQGGLISYSTLCLYMTVISEFYKWLNEEITGNVPLIGNRMKLDNKKSFLYGQIFEANYLDIIGRKIRSLKSSKEYIKWYTAAEKEALLSNFLTLRDKAIFLLTLEGMRIDEVLSTRLSDYDKENRIVRPSRSKGKASSNSDKSNLRPVVLPKSTCEVLNRYIFTERADAETDSGRLSEWLFINLRKDKSQGNALSYRSFWGIIKGCAKRAGIDEMKIRTHSGRSTKVMEILEHQSRHPEDGITDVIIMEMMGWKSLESINPYKQEDNMIIAMEASKKIHRERPVKNIPQNQ
jgi:integrase/recombinase XerD